MRGDMRLWVASRQLHLDAVVDDMVKWFLHGRNGYIQCERPACVPGRVLPKGKGKREPGGGGGSRKVVANR